MEEIRRERRIKRSERLPRPKKQEEARHNMQTINIERLRKLDYRANEA